MLKHSESQRAHFGNPESRSAEHALGLAGAASPAAAGVTGGGNLLGMLGGGVGGGFQAALGLGGYSSAGLFSVGANAAAASAATGAGALAASIGAVAAPLLAVAGLFSFFKKRTKELDAGLRISIEGMQSSIQTFSKIETRRFWGLSKKRTTNFSDASAAVAGPIEKAVKGVQKNIVGLAKNLNIGSAAFDKFTAQIKFSTKGLTEKQIAQELQKQLLGVSNSMASLAIGSAKVALDGETTTQTLTRLSNHLTGANKQLDVLGLRLFDVSVKGAAAASELVKMLGGIGGFNKAAGFYFKNFYSEQQRFDYSLKKVSETLKTLGLSTVPASRAQFRMLVQGMNKVGNSKGVAELLKIAPTFDSMMKAVAKSTQKSVSKIKSVISTLDRALASRSGLSTKRQSHEMAIRFLERGDASDSNKLQAALSKINDLAPNMFATQLDYAREYNRATKAIKTMRDKSATELSVQEKTLAAIQGGNDAQKIQTNLLSSIDGTMSRLSAEIVSVQNKFVRNQKIQGFQQELKRAMAQQGTMPEVLKIVKQVARGGSFFKDHASYVTLSDGRSFSSKRGGPATELAHARRQAMVEIEKSQRAFSAWSLTQKNKIEPLREQIRKLGGVPKFADGGPHKGGWRVVGERGWELEHTGPSRVVSNADARSMLDNREVVAMLDELKKVLVDFKEDSHNGQFQIAKSTGVSARFARKVDQLGMKTYTETT